MYACKLLLSSQLPNASIECTTAAATIVDSSSLKHSELSTGIYTLALVWIAKVVYTSKAAGTGHMQFAVHVSPLLQSKLSKLGSLEDRLEVKLAVATELPGRIEALARQQRVGDSGLESLRGDIKVS